MIQRCQSRDPSRRVNLAAIKKQKQIERMSLGLCLLEAAGVFFLNTKDVRYSQVCNLLCMVKSGVLNFHMAENYDLFSYILIRQLFDL